MVDGTYGKLLHISIVHLHFACKRKLLPKMPGYGPTAACTGDEHKAEWSLNTSLGREPHLDVTVEHCDVLAEQVPQPVNVHTCVTVSAM